MNNVNAALEKHPELKGLSIVDLNHAVGTDAVPESILTTVRNNGGGKLPSHSFLPQSLPACNKSVNL